MGSSVPTTNDSIKYLTMTKSELIEGGKRKADDGPVPQHEVNGCGVRPGR